MLVALLYLLGISPSTAEAAQSVATPLVRLYLANDDHTDYMWTADADTYRRVFVEMLDFHAKLTDETNGNPPPFQSRFNTDGSLWLWEYERQKTPAEFARLIDRIKSGHLSAPLNAVVSCYGAQPTEAVLRGMYYSGRLERRFGLRFTQAVAMRPVPTRPSPSRSRMFTRSSPSCSRIFGSRNASISARAPAS